MLFDYIISHIKQVLMLMFCPPGAGTMIGLKSGKVLAYGTRNKRCAICEAAERKGRTKARIHDCRMNWAGSSKAMEPDIGNYKFY